MSLSESATDLPSNDATIRKHYGKEPDPVNTSRPRL